jgi:hypothetical protein
MTTPPAVFTEFGYALARTEQTLTRQLAKYLAERNVDVETWYALRLVGARGPGVAREALSHQLEESRALDADSTAELLVRLEADGLIAGDANIDLTAEGETLFRSLREHVFGSAAQLLGLFDVADIETTVRTMQAITAQVEKDLALDN